MKKIVFVLIACFGINLGVLGIAGSAETIKIAAIFGRTGDAQQYGIASYQGVNLAVEEINNQGGLLGRQVEVIELDNTSTALGSKIAALQAVKFNVTAVIGAAWSSNSLAIAPVLQQEGIPMVSPISTNPRVTLEGNYIFRVCFTDHFQGRVLAQFARQDLNAQTAVILTNITSDYSIGLSQYFRKSFSQSGGEILWEGKYLEKAIDFTDIMEKVRQLQSDVVFSSGYERDSSLLLKQAALIGIQTIFLGGDGWSEKMYRYVGKTIEGNYFSDHWHPEVPFPISKKIQAQYRHKYGEGVIIAAFPLAYDAVMVLADAIRRAQSLDRQKIRDALAVTTNFQGATGTITFDQHGDPTGKNVAILKFERGTIVFVKSFTP